MVDYSYCPIYEYKLPLANMNICKHKVEESIRNKTALPKSNSRIFHDTENRFMHDYYNVLTDFIKSGHNFTISPVSL